MQPVLPRVDKNVAKEVLVFVPHTLHPPVLAGVGFCERRAHFEGLFGLVFKFVDQRIFQLGDFVLQHLHRGFSLHQLALRVFLVPHHLADIVPARENEVYLFQLRQRCELLTLRVHWLLVLLYA